MKRNDLCGAEPSYFLNNTALNTTNIEGEDLFVNVFKGFRSKESRGNRWFPKISRQFLFSMAVGSNTEYLIDIHL